MNGLDQYRHCIDAAQRAEERRVPHESPEAAECHAVFMAMPRFWRTMAWLKWGYTLDTFNELVPRIGRPLILFRNWRAGA